MTPPGTPRHLTNLDPACGTGAILTTSRPAEEVGMSADTEPITIDLDEVRDDIRKVLADHGLTTLDDVCVDVRLFAQDGVEVGVAVSQDDAPAES